MAYQALYRKWRPLTFSDVVGQEHVTATLRNEITNQRIGHAYLFCGSRGTGKTSTARIFSRALNCENPQNGNPCNECPSCRGILSGEIMDVVEIDAASNNGVDSIRELREEARYAAGAVTYKIYIIDEVHMLSTGAFNALLKLLEEPPEHVVFILATTESHKVLPTILSRCQRFDFKRITKTDIQARLADICQRENAEADEKALGVLAQMADGALRDGLSLLDQCMATGEPVTYELVTAMLGVTPKTSLEQLASAISRGDSAACMEILDTFVAQGKNVSVLADDFIGYMRDLLLAKVATREILDITEEEFFALQRAGADFSEEALSYCINLAVDAANKARFIKNPRVLLEVAFVKMCRPAFDPSQDALAARLAEVERKVERGVTVRQVAVEAAPKKAEKPKPRPPKTPEVLTAETEKVRTNWTDIVTAIRDAGEMTLYIMAEKCSVEQSGQKLLLSLDEAAGGALDYLRENKAKLAHYIETVTGLEPELSIGVKKPEEDELDRFDEIEDFLNSLEE